MNDGRCFPRRQCPPTYVAQATYTACCSDGRKVTVTREGRSQMSQAHAQQVAQRNARCAAEKQARCLCYDPCRGQPYPFLMCPPPSGPNFQFRDPDHTFQLYNAGTGTYHTLTIEGDAGAEYLVIGDGE